MASSTPPAQTLQGQGSGGPSMFPFTVTPDDSVELRFVTRAIRVGTGGDLAVKSVGGEIVIIPDVLSGETVPVMAVKVYSTGTTASGITGYA